VEIVDSSGDCRLEGDSKDNVIIEKFSRTFLQDTIVGISYRTCDLSNREKAKILPDLSLKGIAEKIKSNLIKNIVVLCGAGISTNSGIPDYRSKTGIYSSEELIKILGEEMEPQDMFNINTFLYKLNTYYALVKAVFLPVIRGNLKPTLCHKFLAMLCRKGLMQRDYTQNVDTFERIVGIPPEKLVETHGSYAQCYCRSCHNYYSNMEQYWDNVENDRIPSCACGGTLKATTVLFGEPLPEKYSNCIKEDIEKCDLLIVMGTSLRVYPVASLVDYVGENVPRLLINNELVGPFQFGVKEFYEQDSYRKEKGIPGTFRDVACIGDIDEIIQIFSNYLGWDLN